MALALAAAMLLSAAGASGSSAPVLHGKSEIKPQGMKSMPGAGRFSRESRALQLCRMRAAKLGTVAIRGIGLPSSIGYVIKGTITPAPRASGAAKPQVAFICTTTKDGTVQSFRTVKS